MTFIAIILSAIVGVGAGFVIGKYKSYAEFRRDAETATRDVTEISKNIFKTSRIFDVEKTHQFRPLTCKGYPYSINSIVLWHDIDEINISCAYKEGQDYRADPHPITISLKEASYESLLEISEYLKEIVKDSRKSA